MRRALIWGLGLVVLLLALGVGYRQFVLIPQLRAIATRDLYDPGTVQFRDDSYVGPWTVVDGIYCGELNARNLSGAYTGFQPFIVLYGSARVGDSGVCGASRWYPWWWLRW